MTTTPATQALFPVTPEDYALVDEIRRYFGHIGQCSAALGPSYTPVQIVARHRQSRSLPEGLLSEHFPSGLRGEYQRTAGGMPVRDIGVKTDCYCGWSTCATDEQEARQEWAAHVAAALTPSALSGEAGEGRLARASREAIELIDELNERATSRKFWGISQTMHNKLCTIRVTLARALPSHQGAGE